ncbi:hypothetical protein ACW2Q0_06040 [Nocardia sp. R16R-3T]
MKRTNTTHGFYAENVIDFAARRRGLLERRGADPVAVAFGLAAETGIVPAWDIDGDSDSDDGGWAA